MVSTPLTEPVFDPRATGMTGPRVWPVAITGTWAAVSRTVRRWRGRMRARAILLSMSDRDVRDIGLSRADANREGRKAFWKH